MSNEFIGSGWGFPVDVDSTGGIRLDSRQTEIEQSIRLVISTAPGERPMRPEFG
jgi:phage baseplate assembly protein W